MLRQCQLPMLQWETGRAVKQICCTCLDRLHLTTCRKSSISRL